MVYNFPAPSQDSTNLFILSVKSNQTFCWFLDVCLRLLTPTFQRDQILWIDLPLLPGALTLYLPSFNKQVFYLSDQKFVSFSWPWKPTTIHSCYWNCPSPYRQKAPSNIWHTPCGLQRYLLAINRLILLSYFWNQAGQIRSPANFPLC